MPFILILNNPIQNNFKTTPFKVLLARGHGVNAFALFHEEMSLDKIDKNA